MKNFAKEKGKVVGIKKQGFIQLNAIYGALKRKTTKLYEKEGYKILACKISDTTSIKEKYRFYIENPEGRVSDPVEINKSRLRKNGNFDWVLDCTGDFEQEDVANVSREFLINCKDLPVLMESEKMSIDQVYRELCIYAKENIKEDVITINGGYCSIEVNEFKKILGEIDSGLKSFEIKKRLKGLELLKVNAGRAFDFNMTAKNGDKYKTITFKYNTYTSSKVRRFGKVSKNQENKSNKREEVA
ncbi:MAG: hypothetical protein AB7E42_07540 [Anaerotignaceae bacterium]